MLITEQYSFVAWLTVLFVVLTTWAYNFQFPTIPINQTFTSIAVGVFIKLTLRNIFSTMPLPRVTDSNTFRLKLMNLLEHAIFSLWAYYEIVVYPEQNNLHGSWLLHPALCWSLPAMPVTGHLELFYIAKTGTHVEDLLHMILKHAVHKKYGDIETNVVIIDKSFDKVSTSAVGKTSAVATENDNNSTNSTTVEKKKQGGGDLMMDVHHIVTAALCLVSYTTGYVKIGSVVLLLHDVSDVPLDMLRICQALKWTAGVVVSYITLLCLWAYWRLWILSSVVIKSIIFDVKKSLLFPCHLPAEQCFLGETVERICFASTLGVLLILHIVWFYKLLQKGMREFGGLKKDKKERSKNKEE